MECQVCGSKDFNIEVGKQMCAECGTEIEKFVHLEAYERGMGGDLNHRVARPKDHEDEATKKGEYSMNAKNAYSNWTTYEAYTLILQDWSLALVNLGASTSLPPLVLRLWAGYLNKIEIAFVELKKKKNQLIPKIPRAGLLRNKRDLAFLHQQTGAIKQNRGRKRTKPTSKINRIVGKTKRCKAAKGGRGQGLKKSALNLSSAILAAEQDGMSTETSEDCASQTSGSTVRSSEESNNSVSLVNKPVLRSRAVLHWLNENSHIYDTLDLDSSGKRDPLHLSTPGGDESASSVEEIPRSVVTPLLTNEASIAGPLSSQSPLSSTDKIATRNTNTGALNMRKCYRKKGLGVKEHAEGSHSNSVGQTEATTKRGVTQPTSSSNGSNFNNLREEIDALFKNIKFKNQDVCDRRRRTRFVGKNDLLKYKKFEPYVPTLPKLLALIYIASRINGEEILLLDLLNWCSANHIPYVSAPYLLQESLISMSYSDLRLLRQCSKVPSHQQVYHLVGRLALLLDAQQLPLPRLEVVTSRLLHILCLPESMETGVLALAKPCMRTHAQYPSSITIHSVEIIVAAAIVLLLKIQWSLDGTVEETLSSQVTRINRELRKRGSSHSLFCWRSWHVHINRILWFNESIEPGNPPHPWQDAPLRTSRNASSLAHSFWSDGFWRRAKTTTDRDGVLAPLFHHLMGKNHTSLAELLNKGRLFTATYHHLTGLAQQYTHSWRNDPRDDKQDMKEVAHLICQTSFESNQDNFLLSLSPLREALSLCGSEMKVEVESDKFFLSEWLSMKYLQNSHSLRGKRKTTKASRSQAKNISSIVYQYDESLTSDCPPLLTLRSIVPSQKYPIIQDESDSETENHESPTNEIKLINPITKYWQLPSPRDTNLLPPSFCWLLKLVAYVCQAKSEDLFSNVHLVESYFLGKKLYKDI